jgi:hypothetical protein
MDSIHCRIKRFSDREVLDAVEQLSQRSNALEAELIAYLGEVDERGIYRGEGCSSMFAYCCDVLHFGEGQAYHRIHVARAARRHPELLEKLRSRELHLSGASLLAPKLTDENARPLLEAARHKSKRQIEELLAELESKQDAPARVRKLPVAHKATAQRPRHEPAPVVARPESVLPSPQPEPLGRERYKVQFTVTREVKDLLEEARALLRHQIPGGDLEEIFAKALQLLVEKTKKRRFALTDRPRSRGSKEGRGRSIPAAIRREVYERDKGRCTFRSHSGRRCEARDFLEYHHLDLWAAYGAHEAKRITLRCRAHNQLDAERELGRGFMKRKRRSRLTPG